MPSKKEGYIVLYPEYFDRSLSRGDGRRVPRDIAVSRPTVKHLSNAARKLGFRNRVEENSHHSANWFERRGRVLLLSNQNKRGETLSKAEIVGRIGKRLKEREDRIKKA